MRRYSGEGRSGRCECGHKWSDHHLGVLSRPTSDEFYLPQACAFNQFEGMGDEDSCVCSTYRDDMLPDEHN